MTTNYKSPLEPGRPREHSLKRIRRLTSAELFAGHTRVLIEHDGHEYFLQLTRQGKLILTK